MEIHTVIHRCTLMQSLTQQDAMDVLGMDKDEQLSLFRTVAGILHFGNIEVKQRPREEWATIPTTTGQH